MLNFCSYACYEFFIQSSTHCAAALSSRQTNYKSCGKWPNEMKKSNSLHMNGLRMKKQIWKIFFIIFHVLGDVRDVFGRLKMTFISLLNKHMKSEVIAQDHTYSSNKSMANTKIFTLPHSWQFNFLNYSFFHIRFGWIFFMRKISVYIVLLRKE